MFNDPRAARPLDSCCRESRHARIPLLLHSREYTISPLAELLYRQVEFYAPTRLPDVQQNLFGVFLTGSPFWGVVEDFLCDNPQCRRPLHAMLMDGIMVDMIDQMARQLCDLLDRTVPDDLVFRPAADAERERARQILTALSFQTEAEPRVTTASPPGQKPEVWIGQALCNALAFLVAHETSHQGPQSIGTVSYAMHIGGAMAAAQEIGIILTQDQALAWARELGADMSAFLIMATDRVQSRLPLGLAEPLYRCVTAGVALALKAWDLVMQERCFGNARLHRKMLVAHPPARARVNYILQNAQVAGRLNISGDEIWASRIIDALDALHR